MGATDKARRAAAGMAGVALATAGLSNCDGTGAVDPPPPPLQCSDVSTGQNLFAQAARDDSTVLVTIQNFAQGGMTAASITDTTGPVQLLLVNGPTPETNRGITLVFHVLDFQVPTATFTLNATFQISDGPECTITRTFTLDLSGGGVTVTSDRADPLPLGSRAPAVIALGERRGHRVELEATTSYAGRWQASWTVSAGTLDDPTARRVRWTLPDEPGVHQAELLVDYGPDGLAVDTIMFEVGAA